MKPNGPHDLGGHQGLGPVPVGDGPVFPERWHAEVFATTFGAAIGRAFPIDAQRAWIEELHPVPYMETSYWDKWLYGLEGCLVNYGVLDPAEIEERVQQIAADPEAPLPEGSNPELSAIIEAVIAQGAPFFSELEGPPRFPPGTRVRTKIIRIGQRGHEHTRLPGYAQGKEAVVAHAYPGLPLPDKVVARQEAEPERVYAVRFRARDLWPDAGERDTVCADVWESYLEPAEETS